MIVNPKAEKFSAMLKENKISVFAEEHLKDELHTSLFRSGMEIEGQRLPIVVIIDDSIFVICRILVAGKCINDANRAGVNDFLNKLNASYKSFKYFVTEGGEIVMDICLPTTVEQFEPNMVRALIDLSIKNWEENYRPLMKIVWGAEASMSNSAKA